MIITNGEWRTAKLKARQVYGEIGEGALVQFSVKNIKINQLRASEDRILMLPTHCVATIFVACDEMC